MTATNDVKKTRASEKPRGRDRSNVTTRDGTVTKGKTAKLAPVQPSGRDEVVGAILTAARTLFAERGPASVSLREIAREAHVNFGLVYQYVGTRDRLVAEVLRRTAADNATRLAETKDFDEALRMLLSMGNGTTARILAWAILEGHDVTALVGLSPAVTIVADRARQDAGRAASEEDARFLAAMAMVLAVAWRLFGPAALAAAGLDSSQLEPYGERITQFAPLLGGTAVPPEAGHGH